MILTIDPKTPEEIEMLRRFNEAVAKLSIDDRKAVYAAIESAIKDAQNRKCD